MSFLAKKIREREHFIDERSSSPAEQRELLEELHVFASSMAAIGVASEQDYKDFFYINTLVGEISKNITGTRLSEEELAKISHVVYVCRNDYPINTIINFHRAVKNALDKSEIPITKKAYPQGQQSGYIASPHNLNRWVQSMRQIYAMNTRGEGLGKAFEIVTKKWDKMEKTDFRHWLNFYQSGEHLDYKIAQDGGRRYFEVGDGTAVIPLPRATIKGMPAVLVAPKGDDNNIEIAELRGHPEEVNLKERTKQLIGRLNAAEKLLTRDDSFRKMLGNQFAPWLAKLHELKRYIQSPPMDSGRMSYATIQDIIIKSSNQLQADGFDKSAKVMLKLAQAPPPPPAGGDIPGGDLLGGGPDLGMPGEVPPSGGAAPMKTDPEGAMKEFLSNLGAEGPDDENERAKREAADIKDGAIIVVSEDEGLTARGQMGNPMAPPEDMPAPDMPDAAPEPPPEEDANPKGNSDAVDSAIEGALENVTMDDLIAKLEGSASLYKQRPLARDLTMADLYMQSLGIASYFPEMAEATKSALDSNQYVLTRVENVLAKLRGASAGGTIDDVKAKLEQQSDKQEKKQEQREAESMAPVAPEEGPAPGEAPEMAEPAAIERPPEGVRVR